MFIYTERNVINIETHQQKRNIKIENICCNSKHKTVTRICEADDMERYDSHHNKFVVPYHFNYARHKLLNWAHMNLCAAALQSQDRKKTKKLLAKQISLALRSIMYILTVCSHSLFYGWSISVYMLLDCSSTSYIKPCGIHACLCVILLTFNL